MAGPTALIDNGNGGRASTLLSSCIGDELVADYREDCVCFFIVRVGARWEGK